MNLDQLIKLVKLANNNPNDHEANAAARKVCKMIADNNYAFNNTKEPESARGGTWNDVHRSSEPAWRSTRPPPGPNPWEDRFWEEFARRSRRYEGWANNPPPPPKPPPRPREPVNWTWTETDMGDSSRVKQKKVYEQRLRDCSVCDKSRLTTDDKVPFVCSECQWRKYKEENK